MRILALDIANKTGFAHNCGGVLCAGTITLGTPEEVKEWGKRRMTRRQDPRFCRLVNIIVQFGVVDAIVFEDVQFVKTQIQGQLWATLRSAIWATQCGECSALIECVPVQTLKLYATGKGGAGKAQMCAALARADKRFSAKGETVLDNETGLWLDDNAVDAIWLWKWAQEHLA